MGASAGQRTALVAGAGIGGLAAALALRRAGWLVEVLERDPHPRVDGAGLALWPNGLAALDALGVGAEVRAAGCPQEAGAIRDRRGTALSAIDPAALVTRFGESATMIERPLLHGILLEAVREGTIAFGTEALDVCPGPAPSLTVSGGERRSAALVVVADGVGSALRANLLGPAPRRTSGLVAWRGVVELDRGLEALVVPGEYWARGMLFGMARIGGDRVYWWAAARSDEPAQAPQSERAALLSRFWDWSEMAAALISRTEPERLIRTSLADAPPPRSLVSGAAALLGDAAHPMLPHLGQGACQALEDAAVLGACLRACSDEVPAALAAYERHRLSRVRTLVRRSARMARIAHLRGPAVAVRNLALRLAPAGLALRELDPILDWSCEVRQPDSPHWAPEASH